MKNWTIPVATAQKFAANEYVSACYKMKCSLDDELFYRIWKDTNGNGVFDENTDKTIIGGGDYDIFGCCEGYITASFPDFPTANAYASVNPTTNESVPVFYWEGPACHADGTAYPDGGDAHIVMIGDSSKYELDPSNKS